MTEDFLSAVHVVIIWKSQSLAIPSLWSALYKYDRTVNLNLISARPSPSHQAHEISSNMPLMHLKEKKKKRRKKKKSSSRGKGERGKKKQLKSRKKGYTVPREHKNYITSKGFGGKNERKKKSHREKTDFT